MLGYAAPLLHLCGLLLVHALENLPWWPLVMEAACIPTCAQMAGSGSNLALQLPVTGVLNSLVMLSVDAEALTLATNESPGRVLSAQVCAYANATCGSFQALTARGYLSATILNAGSVNAAFTVMARPARMHARITRMACTHAVVNACMQHPIHTRTHLASGTQQTSCENLGVDGMVLACIEYD